MIEVRHRIPRPDIVLGVVRVENVSPGVYPSGFDERLQHLIASFGGELDTAHERRRTASREMLRNGRYKPTGRGKPASEYLLRATGPGDASAFPRINAPVDACNYVSLKYMVPISLWDVDLAGTDRFVFRLGRPDESYVFNQGGQVIGLEDLLVGCRLPQADDEHGVPIVTPVKDSLGTKTTPETRRIAACIYVPAEAFSADEALAMSHELAALAGGGEGSERAAGVARPGETISV